MNIYSIKIIPFIKIACAPPQKFILPVPLPIEEKSVEEKEKVKSRKERQKK